MKFRKFSGNDVPGSSYLTPLYTLLTPPPTLKIALYVSVNIGR